MPKKISRELYKEIIEPDLEKMKKIKDKMETLSKEYKVQEEELIKAAKTLGINYENSVKISNFQKPQATLDDIFKPKFANQVFYNIPDNRYKKSISDLKAYVCNYPEELTSKYLLWNGFPGKETGKRKGSAPCAMSLGKDKLFFCGRAMHQAWAREHDLPITIDDAKIRGLLIPPRPLENTSPNHTKILRKSTKPVTIITNKRFKTLSLEDSDNNEENTNENVKKAKMIIEEKYDFDMCVYECPVTKNQCRNAGVHDDGDCLGMRYCDEHVVITDELISTVMNKSREGCSNEHLLGTYSKIKKLDKEIVEMINTNPISDIISENLKKSCKERFFIASKVGLGTKREIIELCVVDDEEDEIF